MQHQIVKLERWVLRAPIDQPVANAFGAMTNRPALFVRVTARDGAWGWGEVFCNFPQVGAEHRARLVDSIFAPLLEGLASDDPGEVRALLDRRTHRMALQCGEPGPFAQIAGAIDQALWDLAARRAGMPLWKHLGGQNRVRVYASGIGPDDVAAVASRKQGEGFDAFKLKVGFGAERDRANLAAMRSTVGGATIMIDANQAWSSEEAEKRIRELAEFQPYWVEEPIAADEPAEAWRALAAVCGVPLAAGENIRGQRAFDDAIDAGYLAFLQPDVGKWGGISGGLEIARRAIARGISYCPHWLAGGVGLAASMHALASAGDERGYAEVDANPNPLRDEVFPHVIEQGWVTLSDAPGIGVDPDLRRLSRFMVSTR